MDAIIAIPLLCFMFLVIGIMVWFLILRQDGFL